MDKSLSIKICEIQENILKTNCKSLGLIQCVEARDYYNFFAVLHKMHSLRSVSSFLQLVALSIQNKF